MLPVIDAFKNQTAKEQFRESILIRLKLRPPLDLPYFAPTRFSSGSWIAFGLVGHSLESRPASRDCLIAPSSASVVSE